MQNFILLKIIQEYEIYWKNYFEKKIEKERVRVRENLSNILKIITFLALLEK